MTEKRMVYPGEELGGEEEFLAGPGTYVEDGKIVSAQVGMLSYNEKEHNGLPKGATGFGVVLAATFLENLLK